VLRAAYLKKCGPLQHFPGSRPAHTLKTMKTNPFFTAVVLTTAFLAPGAVAQTCTPTTPPAATATVASPTATVASPTATAPSPTPAPNAIIYLPQLPTPADLANAAAAQGLAIEKIVQTSAQIIVVYEYANGQTNTVAYQLLPAAGAAPTVPAATTTVVPGATTTVVYAQPASAYYYYDPYYYPWSWPWFAPISLGIGVGYGYHGYGFHHGGYGFRHGGYGFRHGGYGFRHGGYGFRHR